jgi:hypothetical protein
MAMAADAIGRKPFARLGEEDVLLERAPGPGDARLRVDDDVLGQNQLVLQAREIKVNPSSQRNR